MHELGEAQQPTLWFPRRNPKKLGIEWYFFSIKIDKHLSFEHLKGFFFVFCAQHKTFVPSVRISQAKNCADYTAKIAQLHKQSVHVDLTPIYKKTILGTKRHPAGIFIFGCFSVRFSGSDHSQAMSIASFVCARSN